MRRLLPILLIAALPLHADSARRIEKDVTVRAARSTVWHAWTTVDGVKTFFAEDAKIELTPGGPYEIYFGLNEPPGSRGGETNQVIAYEPDRMLLFSWNAPPKFGPLRSEHTYVMIRLDDAAGGGTRVRLTHFGWRETPEWNAVYDYFDRAWSFVMESFRKTYDGNKIAPKP